MNKKLLIIGASGHGMVVADVAEQMKKYQEVLFADDNETLIETDFAGRRVIGNTETAVDAVGEYDVFIAIGNSQIRENIYNRLLEADAQIPVLVHPSAVVAPDVKIGVGTVVMAGAVINSGSCIGNGAIINTCASVDHENVIDDFAHISVGAHLAGNVSVGKRTWVGIGAVVSNNVSICNDVLIGAGGVVIRNIVNKGTYVGVPATKK